MRVAKQALLFAAVVVATLLCALVASAAGKIVVFHAEGDGADAVAKALEQQLPKGVSAGDAEAFHAALAQQGHKGPMGKAIDAPASREKLLEQVRKAAAAAGVDAVVIIRIKKPKKDRVATLMVVDPKSTALAREDEVTLPPKKGDDDSKPVSASVLPALEKLAPPPEPEPKVEEKQPEPPPVVEEPKPTRVTGDFAQAMVVVSAGGEGCFRSFAYNDEVSKNLRAYNVSRAAGFSGDLQVFPLASMGGHLGGLGLEGGYGQALGLKSAPASGEKIDTSWSRWHVALRYRLKVGDGGGYVSPSLGYGAERFTFSGASEKLAAEVPAAKYGFVKLAFDGRVPLGPVALMLGGGYLFTSSGGSGLETIGSRFPHHVVRGVDLGAGLGVGLTKGLEARLAYRYRRFFYSMNPVPGDAYVAGGALDQLSSLHLGVAYAY